MIFSLRYFLIALLLLWSSAAFASPTSKIADFYKDAKWNIFPVPIFKTSPSEGKTYGLMPVVIASDKNSNLKTIVGNAYTYNKITGLSSFLAAYIYPREETMLHFFAEYAQRFSREATAKFHHLPQGKGSIIFGGKLSYIQYPFRRFFGFGPATLQTNETNYVGENFELESFGGFRFFDSLSLTYKQNFIIQKLHDRAINNINDTKQTFAGDNQVVGSNNFIHTLEASYDTHENPSFSDRGEMLSLAYLTSLAKLGSDFTFQGYDLKGKLTRSLGSKRFTTVIFAKLSQRFGNTIPFYHQNQLGGEKELRAFVKGRFTGRHSLLFDIEERIEIHQWTILNTKVALSLDPFFSIGQVFNDFSEIQSGNLQPVGGIGIRAKVKPAVVGRLDIGYGREGLGLFATIDYPF